MPSDPYLTNISSTQKDPYLSSVVDRTNRDTGRNRKEVTSEGYDIGSLFRQMDFNASTGSSMAENQYKQGVIDYLKGTVLQYSSEGRQFDVTKKLQDAILINSFTGRDITNDILPNYDHYMKIYTGADTGKGILGSFKDYFEAYDMQKSINNMTLALMDIGYDDPRRAYYEKQLDTARTNYALKIADVSNTSEFWKKVASSGNIVAQSVDQMMKTMTASIIAGVAGGAVAGSLYGGQGVAGNLMQSIAVEESMKKASLATAVGYTATVMTQAEASEIAETLMGMVDDNGRHIPLDIIKDYAYTFGLLSSVVELGDEMITPIGRYKIGDLTISEALNEVRDLVKSYPLGYVGLGLAGTTAEAVQEGAQGMIRQTGIDLAIKKSNERGVTSFDTGTDEDEARNKWNVGWEEFKESIIPMGVSQLLTGGLSIGASYTTAALSRPMSLTPQMRADANRYFNAGTGKVYDIGYADTAGEGPVNRFASSSASEGAQVQQKASPVLFYVNRQTGALVPLYKSDKQYLEYLREQGVTGFRGIQVNENILEQASSVGSARNVASLLANILDRGQVVGYDGSEIVFDSQESVERAKEFIDMFRGSLFGGDEFVFQGDVNITGNDDGTYTFMFEDNNGRTRRFSFRVQNENDSVVEAVRNEDGQTERTGNINPVYNQMEADLSKSGDLFRKSLTEAFEDKELEDSAKFFISQITGMDAKELDQLWDSDYQAVIDRLPEGVDMNVIEQGARFMPLLSQITGRSVQDLFSDEGNRIVLTYGKAKTVIDKNGKKRKVRGGLDHDIDPDTGVNTYTIKLTDMASGDGGDTLVHELMHLARALASPERLSGFVGLKGYTGKYGGMWESDIKRTKDGRFLLGARYYDSYGQALALVRDNEEKFVEDFFRYLRTGQAPNAQVATFFGQLKQFLQSFRNAYDRELDQETKNAFDMLLNGELYVQPGQTLKEAVETSEATLTDNVASQWEANDYSEEEGLDAEGNPLYSLQRATSAETSVPNQIPKGYGSGMDYLRNWAKRSFDADIFNPGQTNFEQGMGISDTATRYLAERKGIESLGTDPFNRTREYNERVASMAMDRRSDTSSAMNVLNVIDDDEAMELVIAQSALALKDGGVAVFQIFHGDQTGEGRYKKENAQYQRNMRGEEYVPHVEKFYNKVEAKGDYILAQDPKMDAVNKVTGGRFDFSVAEYGAVGKPFKNANGSTISRSKYGVGKQVGNQIYVHREYASDVIPAGLIEKAEALLPEGFEYNTLMYDTKRPEVLRFDQAPDFDTAREPIPGDMVTVNTETGEVKRSHSDQIWHHKWEWVKNDYMGFNVKESYDWSKKWTSKIKDVNGIGSRRVWEEKLSKAGLKADREALYSLSSEAQSQYDEVVAKYKDTDQWLKAPNGADTNLGERLWVIVRTPNFIRWFGDWINDPENASKIVDENGEPMPMFHGTSWVPSDGDSTFMIPDWEGALGQGVYFTSVFSEACDYASEALGDALPEFGEDENDIREEWLDENGYIIEAFLNIRDKDKIFSSPYGDGIWGLVKSPNQIKSINNNGDFSNGNDSILYSLASDRQWQVMDANTQRRIDADYDRTYNEYYGTDRWMNAPNGQPTNLTERQWVQVRTPAFKEWFGDWEDDPSNASKILDENGEPLVVYHGTMESFEVFDAKKGRSSMDIQGMFFSPWELDAKGYGTNVRAFFLNIKNPANFTTGFSALSKYKGKMYAGINAREDLITTGYDGVNNDNEEFIAFNPNQIKSATDNNGAFSRDNDSILFSLAPAVGTEEFDQWFSGSKVVDAEGNPLVVYHGSPVRGIDEFSPEGRTNNGDGMIYATDDRAVADVFSMEHVPGSSSLSVRFTGNRGEIYPLYMSMRHPLDLRNLSEEEKQMLLDSYERIWHPSDARKTFDEVLEAGNHQLLKDMTWDVTRNLPAYGYDGLIANMLTNWQSEQYGGVNYTEYAVVSPEQVRRFAQESEAETLYALTPEQETRAMQELDSFPEVERNRIASNFARLSGTPWHREAMKALLLRRDMKALMAGRELDSESILNQPEYRDTFKAQIKALRKGIDGIFEYLEKMSFIANPKKCVHAVNSSLLNCNPSLDCAMFCYASEGNYVYWQSVLKSEMVTMAVESDPVRASEIIARQYKATTDYMVGKALRIFDKGDFSEQYVTLIKEMNKRDIAVQVFSKRPDLLRQIDNGVNIAMLSIDKSNRQLAEQNPDLAIATVYAGKDDVGFIEQNKERYDEHGGVILPVKLGNKLLPKEEIKALPQWARVKYTCPIDAGTKKLGEWNCQKCDINGTGGCFYKNTAGNRKEKIYASLQDMNVEAIDEGTRQITEILSQLGITPDSGEFRRIVENLSRLRAEKLAGIDPETERTSVQGDGEYSETGDTGGDGLLSLTAEENNRLVDGFVAQYPDTEVIELDGLRYVKHSNDAYTVDELRSIKDSVSETLHSLKLQPELDFSGQLELDFNGDQNNGPTTAMGQRWNAGGATGAPVADLRGLRPGVARYFDWSRGWNGQEPSTAINDQWDNLGYISFIGAEFRTPEDLAKLYSVYRNPKLEYSHIILTKGDTVRAHIALSTGVPFSAYAVPLGGLRYVYSYMSRIGADGYYLMHNHPSGDIDYSSADKSLSLYFEDNIPGFRGHIILDHDKFGFFDEHMKFSKRKAEGMHEASEEKLTSGFKETYLDLEKSFGAIYTRSMNEPTFSIFYMDYRGKLIEIEDLTDIPTRDYVRDKMKAGFHSYAVAFTNDRSLFEKMRAMAVSAKPKYNFLYVLYVDPDSAEHIEYFGKNSLYPYFNDNVWGYVKGSKNKSGEAFIPKFQHDDDTGTLYSLSPERQSEIIQQRKAEIQRAVEAGIFVRTEYLNEFRGEDWVQDELNLRDWMQDNPDVVTIAKDSGSFEDFKRRMTGKEETAGGDADDVPFGEEGLTEEYGDEIPFDEDFGEEEQALSDSWLERIYSYSKALSSKERDRQFANEWTSSEDKTLELARTLANYSDAFFKPKPKSRSGGYWYTKNVWGAFKGVSTKLLRLNDGTGFRGKKQGRSSSSEIQEVQNLIRQNPRAYRNAYTTVMMAESRAGQVKAGMQTGIGSDADWMRFEMIDDDIAQELERIEAESEEATATRKAGVDYKTKYEDLKRKMRDAQRDLEKANEGLKTSVANLRSQLDLARANESALRNSIAEAEKDIASAEKEYSDLIERLGGKIEALEEQNAEYRERARKARQLEKQLEERRARVEELRSQLTGANREVRRLTNAVSARDRYIEAKRASDYRNKRIRQILSATEFNPSTLDASFEESLNWVAGLFERDEEVMEGRRTVSELIAVLKRDIEMADLNGEDVTEKRQQLIELQRKKKESAWKEPPAQLASYLPEGYVLRADNRPSMWSAQELDVLLGALRLMRADARQMLEQKQNERMNRLNEVSYGYFRQAFGRDADMDEEGEMSSSALRDDLLANIAEKDFNPVKERYLSYHLYKAKIQRLARLIDGDREGVVYDWFVRRNYDCQTNELRGINRRLDLGDTVWSELGLKNGELSKEGFKGTKENGTPYSLTRGQMIGVYVYSQSQLGYEKLTSLSGNGIKAEDISAITGGLTEKERAWGDFLLAEMQSNYRRLADTFYNVWNQNLGQRPAYFPLVSSESKTIRAEDADFLCGQVSGKDGKAYVDKGFTKECNPNALYPLKLDVTATWNQQVRRQEHFIAYGEWARDSQYLLDHGQLGEEIKRAKGNPFYRELNRMTNHVISNYITTGTDFDRTISKYFSARNAAALTASISTALKQAGSIGAVFADDIAFRKLFTGEGFFRNFLKANEELNAEYGDVKDVREFIYYNAPDIRNRRIDFEVMAYLNRVYGGAVSNAIQRTTNKIMKYTTNAVDRAVVERLWLGRYYTEYENLTKKGMSQRQAHKEAVFRASQLISETQPTSMRMDQSGLQIEAQKSSLLRMISVFTNQAMNTANMILMDVPREIRNRNWKKVVGTAVAVAVNVGIVALVSGRFVKKGDEDDGEYAWRLARELLGTVAQTVDPVWGGNLLGGIMYAYSKNSYLSEFSEIGGVLRNLMTPNTKKTKWQKWADALETLGGEALNVMGIPGGNLINRPLKAIQNENAGYLLNSTWGQIVESYR